MKDVGRFVQTLPGVVFGGDDFRNDIVVRGGSPLENLYIVDNIEIPNINHFATFGSAGGALSFLNSDLLSDMTFLTGGYPAPYSNRLSSVLQIAQREGNREGLHGQLTFGFGGAGGIAEGPIKGKGSWFVSARRSFLELFGLSEEEGVPDYADAQTKIVYDINPKNRIWVVSLGSWDSMRKRPNFSKVDNVDYTDVNYSGWRNAAGINWQHLFGFRGVGLLGITDSLAHVDDVDKDLRLQNALTGRQNSTENEMNVKYDLTLQLPRLGEVQAGGHQNWTKLDYDQAQPLGMENPFSPLPGRVNPNWQHLNLTASQSSGYLQFSRPLSSRFSVTAGGRADHYGYLDITRFSPRAGITFKLTSKVNTHLSYGTYYQQPFYLYIEAVPANRNLVPVRADHYVAGITHEISPGMRFTVEAYEKRYRDYPVSTQYPQVTLANAGNYYDPTFFMLPLASAGRGRARGVELYLQKRLTKRTYGQVSFTLGESKQAARDGVYRPSSFDSRYVLNLTGGCRLSPHWEVAGRYVYVSGRPYTPFDLAISRAQHRGVYDLSKVNALRTTSYQRLDFRVDRAMRFAHGSMNVYFGLQNALNRSNFYSYGWNYHTNAPKLETLKGMFLMCGLDWRF